MDKPNTKVPSNLLLTAFLSSGITIAVSICYIVLSILALIYRFNCDVGDLESESIDASKFFWKVIYRVYIQDSECSNSLALVDGITQTHTVFVFVAITLSFSVLTLVTGIVLASLINNRDTWQYLNVYVFTYIGSWVSSLVVDLTFGTFLGMDYTHLTKQLADTSEYNFSLEVIRQGAFYLMTISLKGYAIHAVNFVLILLMIVFLYDYQDMAKQQEHSVHKVGALDAFEQPRRDHNWGNPEMYAGPFGRGQVNNAYVEEDPRTPSRNDNNYYNSVGPGSFSRSDSWNHQTPPQTAPKPIPSSSSSRPFSYLEEVRRPVPVKPPASPAVSDGWRGAWPPPPVPAPDYSPHAPRRLKSALKPNYM